jgi:hypothetical protein
LLQFKVTQIFLDDGGHRHAKSRREILHRHRLLSSGVRQEANQAVSQVFRVPGLVKLNRQLLAVGHLAKVWKVRTDNRHSVRTGQVGDATATRRRRIRHNRHRGTLEEFRQMILMHVSRELNCGIVCAQFPHQFDIACGLRMVSASDDQLRIRQDVGHSLECVDHEFEALIRSPLTECQNAMLRIAAPGEIRVFRSTGQNTVRPNVNIFATIFFGQYPAIAWHEHRHRIRQEQHSGGNGASHLVNARVTNARILQIDSIHQVMQGDVRVASTQAGEQRSKKAQKGIHRITSERTKKQIEPHHIRLQFRQGCKKPN